MDATVSLARNVVQTKFKDISGEVIEATKKQILDCLGVAIAGSSAQGVKELSELAQEWGGSQQSSVICYGIKLPAPNAAQVNAAMMHALDYDDGHSGALVHPGVISVSSCFAASERAGGVSGKELITAVTLGTDMICRLGMATRTEGSRATAGWHFTTICGFMAAAAAAGRLIGLDEEKMVNALGIAYHQSSGNMQCVIDGALTKRMGPGFATKGGITAALMAEKGITGAKNCLEGEVGLYKLYHRGRYDASTLISDLGRKFEGINVAIKRYPCCGIVHPFIDAALALVSNHRISADEVDKIKVFRGEGTLYVCEPLDAKQKPRNPVDSQFSIPWAVAVAVVRGKVSLDDFTEDAIKDVKILEISKKVTHQLDESLTRSDNVEPGRVEIMMKSGEVYSKQMDNAMGYPPLPVSFDDCVRKFFDCATHAAMKISKKNLHNVVEMIGELEKVEDATEVIRLVSRGKRLGEADDIKKGGGK